MSEMLDLVGKVFGRLVVVKFYRSYYDKNNRQRIYWICKCSCGNPKDIIVRGDSLRSGKTQSCKCLNKEKTKEKRTKGKGEASFNKLFGIYKSNSKKTGKKFSLSKEEFREITSKNCYYCGAEPIPTKFLNIKSGEYYYNGIDRIDNSIGYEINNCVPCCKDCNFLKGSHTENEFLSIVNKIYSFSIAKNNRLGGI